TSHPSSCIFTHPTATAIYTLSLHDALPISKMQVSRSPTARCTSAAATAESTPPDSPQIARFEEPTTSRIRRTSCSMKWPGVQSRSEEHTSELQSPCNLVCRLLLEKKK